MTSKNIVAVVVTYNRVELLKECISALILQGGLAGIIIVNNCSTDLTKTYLDELQKSSSIDVYPVHLNSNTGGAGGFYIGLDYSVKLGYEYAWIMDDDAIPVLASLSELIKAANYLNDSFGFLASNVIDTYGCCMNTPKIDLKPNKNGYPDWARKLDQGYLKISMATFVSVFIKTETIINVGLPVKEMFIWGDDSEYTQRISNIYPSYFIATSKVVHKRMLKSSLSIISETSNLRLKWFKLFYRNNGYRIRQHEGYKLYLKYIIKQIFQIKNIIIKAENRRLLRIQLLLLGLINSLFFNPLIKHPKK